MNKLIEFLSKFSIGRKIKFSFLLIILSQIIYSFYISLTLSSSIDTLNSVTNDISRSVDNINQLKRLIENSKSYTTNWIHVPKYEKDKIQLSKIHDKTYPALKNEIINQIQISSTDVEIDSLLSQSISMFDSIIVNQNTIKEILNTKESYDDIINVLICEEVLERSIIPMSSALTDQVDKVLSSKKSKLSKLTDEMKASFKSLNLAIIILCVLGVIIGLIIATWLTRNITNPLGILQEKVSWMSQGVIPSTIQINNDDEIGEMSKGINLLIESLNRSSDFAREIGKGNLEVKFDARGTEDVLGQSLILMRSNLSKVIKDTNEAVRIASEEGMLSTQIDVTDKDGIWKELGMTINNLLSSISSPLFLLNDITKSMALGDLTNKYGKDEKGDIHNLKEYLNNAIDSLNSLLNKIADSADLVDNSSADMLLISEEVSSNTGEIASAIAEISSGAQNQVVKVDEVSSLIEGILSSSDNMESKATAINDAAKIGFDKGIEGRENIDNITNNINQISSFASKTNDSIDVLTTRSREINSVLEVISEIASQTNLLALNAAIEAAQAGDAGRGFAVVAEEIRKLAEGSKESALQIETLIREIQADTKDASDTISIMNKTVLEGKNASKIASEVFEEIEKSSRDTLSHSEEILKATFNQREGVTKVVSISESVVVIAEETAAGTEQTASAVSELSSAMSSFNEKSHQMKEVATELKGELEKIVLIK
ncbi:MAG: methyl-accepting chemotaxis protein [Ekhidna sp.]